MGTSRAGRRSGHRFVSSCRAHGARCHRRAFGRRRSLSVTRPGGHVGATKGRSTDRRRSACVPAGVDSGPMPSDQAHEDRPDATAVRAFLGGLQDRICAGLEALDREARFLREEIPRPGGGVSRPRVLEDGPVIEKAAVQFTHTRGNKMPLEPQLYMTISPMNCEIYEKIRVSKYNYCQEARPKKYSHCQI